MMGREREKTAYAARDRAPGMGARRLGDRKEIRGSDGPPADDRQR